MTKQEARTRNYTLFRLAGALSAVNPYFALLNAGFARSDLAYVLAASTQANEAIRLLQEAILQLGKEKTP
jgi:hypothetical protein